MNDQKEGRVDINKARQAFEAGREARTHAGHGKVTLRATADLVENTYLTGRIGKYHFESDEPPSRGGEDRAASPLEYFLIGTAFCFLSQVVQFSPLYDVILNDVNVDLRAEFDDAEKHNLDGPGAAFQKVTIKLRIKSPSPEEQIEKLIAHAERGCHAAASLSAAVPLSLEAKIVHQEADNNK